MTIKTEAMKLPRKKKKQFKKWCGIFISGTPSPKNNGSTEGLEFHKYIMLRNYHYNQNITKIFTEDTA